VSAGISTGGQVSRYAGLRPVKEGPRSWCGPGRHEEFRRVLGTPSPRPYALWGEKALYGRRTSYAMPAGSPDSAPGCRLVIV